MRPRIVPLAHPNDGSVHGAAVGDRRVAPVLAALPPVKPDRGPACRRGLPAWLLAHWSVAAARSGPVQNVSGRFSGFIELAENSLEL